MDYSSGSIQRTRVEDLLEGPERCSIRHDAHFGDEGCRRLFSWLKTGIDYKANKGSKEGSPGLDSLTRDVDILADRPAPDFPKSFSYVELRGVGMTDTGLGHLVDWLQCLRSTEQARRRLEEDVVSLTDLILNAGTSELAEAFVFALSTPVSIIVAPGYAGSLSSLSLSNNPLSAPFRRTFFKLLPALPKLRELYLSVTGVDGVDADALAKFIRSGKERCSLRQLNASANYMGYMGVRAVVDAVRYCWTLEKVDLFSNDSSDDNVSADEIQKDAEDAELLLKHPLAPIIGSVPLPSASGTGHLALNRKLTYFLHRNILLRRRVTTEALDLLRYSRLMLLKTVPQPGTSLSSEQEAIPPHTLPFFLLPTEIQLSILAHLAPHLSRKQRIRVFEYAADRTTLPSVRLSLPERALTRNSSKHGSSRHEGRRGNLNLAPSPSGARNVIFNVNSRSSDKLNRRQKWLELVGCDSYDPTDTV
ncbi:hypothetical protein CVT26_001937 [Gymnopilus dilepis]|uniref:F-box domain-containing protein n=1 Tax=Gymnopilus dilepis TaxID=231916 RepID=A0A409VRZ6_9AGAR|nr:hypothetical protein CVT26_001937 [Gymnopilus dilepis]